MASTRGLSPPDEQAAAIAALAKLVEKEGSPADVGPLIGSSGEAVRKAVKHGEIGPRVIRLVATYLKMSVVEMVAKYGTAPAAPAATVVEREDRYPSRGKVLAGAAALGYSPAAIAMVADQRLKGADPGEDQWWAELDAAERVSRRQAGKLAAIKADAGAQFDVPSPKSKGSRKK